ncbi:MAG: metal-dependent hydrolase [Gammaproteobacteria bacterium]|nr:metal-dependent hydrolase [Gammaproteobacteria bacterium]
MATPIGHSLLALAVVRVFGNRTTVPTWHWYLVAVVAANAADLDFLPGLLVGDINRFHQGFSHTLLAALIFAALCTFLHRFLACRAWQAGLTGGLCYASHLVLDFYCHDGRAPFGMPLLWPVSDERWNASFSIFSGVTHGSSGDTIAVFVEDLFSLHNLIAVSKEALFMLPLLLLFAYTSRTYWRKR